MAHGDAAQKALLYVYLGRTKCLSEWNTAARDGAYHQGHSYFEVRDLGRKPYAYAWVSGAFKKTFTAHAGTSTGREHVCAYLETPNAYGGYRVTSAHGSGHYTVTH